MKAPSEAGGGRRPLPSLWMIRNRLGSLGVAESGGLRLLAHSFSK